MIRLEGVSKRYGPFWALQELDLAIPAGELFGFLGPNGAGKTTTIKILTGLIRPTRGRVMVGGFDVTTRPVQAKARLGYVPDHPFVYERLTGREFLRFSASLHGVPSGELGKRITRLTELFELGQRLDQLVGGYSHGMRQKLTLASALLHRPPVLIIDEPMVGLDPQGAQILKSLLREHCRDGGSVFLSTHTLEVAQQVCDRIGIIQEGRLRALGSMDELQAQAQTRDRSLEEIFLELTGGTAMQAVIRGLEDD